MGLPPALGPAAFGIMDVLVKTLAAALKGVLVERVGVSHLDPSPAMTAVRVADLSLMQPFFACRVAGDGVLVPIWEEVARSKRMADGLVILNQALLWVLP